MAVETDGEDQSLGFEYSLVWFVKEIKGKAFLLCRQHIGITDVFVPEDIINKTESDNLSKMVYHDWKKAFASAASVQICSGLIIRRYMHDLEDMGFLHRLRSYNTFGQINPLLSKYPKEYLILGRLMRECFLPS